MSWLLSIGALCGKRIWHLLVLLLPVLFQLCIMLVPTLGGLVIYITPVQDVHALGIVWLEVTGMCCCVAVVQVCIARSRPGGWHKRVTGVAGLSNAWQYVSCCSQQLGECTAGWHTA
jgi:hypothetical protein